MKKAVRAVWISLLSGLAFFAACRCHNQTSQVEKQRAELTRELDSINDIIERRSHSCVYGSPEIIKEYGRKTNELRERASEIQKQLDELNKKQ